LQVLQLRVLLEAGNAFQNYRLDPPETIHNAGPSAFSSEVSFKPEHMAEIVNMLDVGKITDDAAVQIIRTRERAS
jgi:hypothetical protein